SDPRMNVSAILFGQAFRLFRTTSIDVPEEYMGANAFRALEKRYGFFRGPRELKEYESKNGITFERGLFRKQNVIDRLVLFENGILAEGALSTDIVDEFIDDVLEWLQKEIRANAEITSVGYLSHLEFESNINL